MKIEWTRAIFAVGLLTTMAACSENRTPGTVPEKSGSSVNNKPIETTTQAPGWVWVSRGAGGGGAFFAPSFNPRNPQDMWVTSDMSPVLHTTNLNKPDRRWSAVHFSQFSGGRSSHVRFTSDPNILYALDGTKKGPIKTTDGGVTWTALPGWTEEGVMTVLADPNSTTRVLVATKDRISLSTNGGFSFMTVFDSPENYVAGAYFDAASKAIYVGSSKGLLKSVDDGKLTVQTPALPRNLEMISFTAARDAAGGPIRFACVAGGAGAARPGMEVEQIFRGYNGIYIMDEGATAWTEHDEGIADRDKLAFIAMATANSKTIFTAGAGTGGSLAVYKIPDATKDWKWESVFQDRDTGFKPNHNIYTGWEGNGGDRDFSFDGAVLDFDLDPGDANYAAITGDGFVHFTGDGGTTWHEAYVAPEDENPADKETPKSKAYTNVGLNDTAVHWLAWVDQNTLFAGYTDIEAARSTDAGKTWAIPSRTNLLNTQYKVELAPNGSLYAASSSMHDIYQTWTRRGVRGTGNLIVSTDKGANWTIVHKFTGPVIWEQLDPKDASGNTMYVAVVANASTGGIYKTTNLLAGTNSTWDRLAAPPRTVGHPYNIRLLDDGTIVASYGDNYVGNDFTLSSGVFASSDDGKTWEDRSDPAMQYYTKDVIIDPTDPGQNTWYAAVHTSFGPNSQKLGGLYKTTNRGKEWKEVCALTGDGGESCTINRATKEIFFTTESQGLFYAPDCTAPDLKLVTTNYPYMHPYRVFINPFDSADIWVISYGNGISQTHGVQK